MSRKRVQRSKEISKGCKGRPFQFAYRDLLAMITPRGIEHHRVVRGPMPHIAFQCGRIDGYKGFRLQPSCCGHVPEK